MSPLYPESLGRQPASGVDDTLERNTAITGTPEGDPADGGDEGVSTPEPAEGGDDVPPPQPGSPQGTDAGPRPSTGVA